MIPVGIVFTVDTLDSVVMWEVTWTDTLFGVFVVNEIFRASNTLLQVFIPEVGSIAGDTLVVLNIRFVFRAGTFPTVPLKSGWAR